MPNRKLIACLIIFGTCSSAAFAGGCGDSLTKDSLGAIVIACVKEQQATIGVLKQELDATRADIGKLRQSVNSINAVPSSPAALANVTSQRRLGVPYQNDRGRTRVVIVTASRAAEASTMRAYVSEHSNGFDFQAAKNTTSVIATLSFIGRNYPVEMTFVVPVNYHYAISADANDIVLIHWIEVDL